MSVPAGRQKRSARFSSGFTLVELLVVIGIIAVLIGLLLPALGRAREQSRRVVCLSNMRELSTSLRIYATTYRDACPIGYIQQKAFSYIMNWSNPGSNPPKPSQMGLLVVANICKNPKTFYCPSEIMDWQFMYQPNPSATTYSGNPWPFATSTAGTHTRLGYSARPIANWPANSATGGLPATKSDATFWLPSNPSKVITLPKFARLNQRAILADTCYNRAKVLQRHKQGINVLYGNGSARFVLMTKNTFDKPDWHALNEDTAFNPIAPANKIMLYDGTYPDGLAPGTLLPESQWTGLWIDLDRAN